MDLRFGRWRALYKLEGRNGIPIARMKAKMKGNMRRVDGSGRGRSDQDEDTKLVWSAGPNNDASRSQWHVPNVMR